MDVEPETWVEMHQQRLQDAYVMARARLAQAYEKRKKLFNRRAKEAPLCIGDKVYKRLRGIKGRQKIQDAYSPKVFRVIEKMNVHDVYTIELSDGFGEAQWVNRAELRSCPVIKEFPGEEHVVQARNHPSCKHKDSSSDSEDSETSHIVIQQEHHPPQNHDVNDYTVGNVQKEDPPIVSNSSDSSQDSD